MLNRLSKPFVYFVERWYPDPLIFAFGLTLLSFIMAMIFTDSSLLTAIIGWGDGFKMLMTFIGQLAFTLIASTALANTRPVTKLLQIIANIPKTEFGCYALAALVGALASLLSWALGLVVGGIVARHIQFRAQQKGITPHYALLVASAYSGFVVWHMGYSGSAQLFVATKGHVFEKLIGVIPVSETLFSSYNVIAIILCLITIPILVGLMRPKKGQAVGLSDAVVQQIEAEIVNTRQTKSTVKQELTNDSVNEFPAPSYAERIERMRFFNIAIGGILLSYLVYHFATKGLDLDLNIVNWSFLALGLILSDSPVHYVRLVADAGRNVGQIILQYPLYAGLMGLMIKTGLAKVLAGAFTAFATKGTLAFWTFISAGLLNMFIPSGGGQWSVQGAVCIDCAKALDVPYHAIVSAVAYGDQWTNMIQPFWTIPLLAIAGLKMRDMMGYTFVTLIWTGIIFGGTLLFLVPGI